MIETEGREQGTQDACRRCGAPAGSFRFCLSCGASVDDELGQVDAADAPASRLRRVLRRIVRWRTPLVLIPALGALGAVGALGAQMLTAEVPKPETRTQITCWDRSTAESADACSTPSGVDGLRWVFPTFHPRRDDCVDVLLSHPEYTRPAMYECDFKVDKRWIKVTYMQLADVTAARVYFEKYFPDAKREEVSTAEGTPYRYVWREHTDLGYELAAMYIDYPYAVSINAPAASYRNQALRELDFRHPDKMRILDD